MNRQQPKQPKQRPFSHNQSQVQMGVNSHFRTSGLEPSHPEIVSRDRKRVVSGRKIEI